MIEITICDLKMKTPKNATLLRMPKNSATSPVTVESRILFLRHQRVILDADLAALYGVPVRVLNQQVKRNRDRFPSDFLFRVTPKNMTHTWWPPLLAARIHRARRDHGRDRSQFQARR